MARVSHRSGAYPSPVTPNGRSSLWPAVMPIVRGMQPPPQDKRKLRRETTRLAWAIHCLLGSRATTVLLLARKDKQIHELRRQHDAYSMALQDADPVAFAEVEQQRREWDDPIKALRWAQRGGLDDLG